MSDLVERARTRWFTDDNAAPIIKELADRIEALEKALRPFARAADAYDPPENDDNREAWAFRATIGQLRAARVALKDAAP